MPPRETQIYIAVLSGLIVLSFLITIFINTIVRFQRKKAALSRENIREQYICLDTERERISRDLHDDLGASLSAIKLHLHCLKNLDANNEKIVSGSELCIDNAMQKLKHISFNMMPGILKREGLNAALREMIDVMTFPARIRVNYECNIGSFDKEAAIHIYRIAQEIMTNIIRHAGATSVNFSLLQKNKLVELHASDNGTGFDADNIQKVCGSGLQNIMTRADLLKANLYLTAKQGKGVDYIIQIPFNGEGYHKSDNS